MRSDLRYLGLGLTGGVVVAALLLFGAAIWVPLFSRAAADPALTSPSAVVSFEITPAFTASNTSTPTSLPSITPYPTVVLSPTPTLTEGQRMRLAGQLFYNGALSLEQQNLLYESSIQYIARSPEESREMAVKINQVAYGYADNTCGPLSMAILRDAGLVSADLDPHDFWLLNPWLEHDREILEQTLPASRFDHFIFYDWMKDFDWKSFPLLPGDFLYIHAGGGGNFDHMLVVNRVDSRLRAYSVTNYRLPDGFVIDEVMLYDPADPQAGILYTWSARARAPSGSTGFGGFEVWRPLAAGPSGE